MLRAPHTKQVFTSNLVTEPADTMIIVRCNAGVQAFDIKINFNF